MGRGRGKLRIDFLVVRLTSKNPPTDEMMNGEEKEITEHRLILEKAFVQGIDLYPPPDAWVPPNCKFEGTELSTLDEFMLTLRTVDDALKPWMLQHKQDLIHIRDLQGSFTDHQWTGVYKQAYENLLPGGWIEQIDASVGCYSDDSTLSPTSLLARSGPMYEEAAAKAGKGLDSVFKARARIEAAGFVNIQEKLYKVLLGDWAKNPMLKKARRFCKVQLLSGLVGYSLYLLTKFGSPTPWSAEEVQVLLAKFRAEIEVKGVHAYYLKRRVWGQKPFDPKVKA